VNIRANEFEQVILLAASNAVRQAFSRQFAS